MSKLISSLYTGLQKNTINILQLYILLKKTMNGQTFFYLTTSSFLFKWGTQILGISVFIFLLYFVGKRIRYDHFKRTLNQISIFVIVLIKVQIVYILLIFFFFYCLREKKCSVKIDPGIHSVSWGCFCVRSK